ncbi:hypothetical protein G1C97_0997 [Bifidobacterium sp. DSM 109959]|uniref:Uncharacterized protein n=1 Tax=Bifidobacterium olomucense TaxID=2675324 RepID=A0A7Y0EX54_9BIFI|nr:hypothetical protein [Bifidobacterium sp. DSM 109959]
MRLPAAAQVNRHCPNCPAIPCARRASNAQYRHGQCLRHLLQLRGQVIHRRSYPPVQCHRSISLPLDQFRLLGLQHHRQPPFLHRTVLPPSRQTIQVVLSPSPTPPDLSPQQDRGTPTKQRAPPLFHLILPRLTLSLIKQYAKVPMHSWSPQNRIGRMRIPNRLRIRLSNRPDAGPDDRRSPAGMRSYSATDCTPYSRHINQARNIHLQHGL